MAQQCESVPAEAQNDCIGALEDLELTVKVLVRTYMLAVFCCMVGLVNMDLAIFIYYALSDLFHTEHRTQSC